MQNQRLVFESELGWVGVEHAGRTLLQTTLGHKTKAAARSRLSPSAIAVKTLDTRQKRWVRVLQQLACGKPVDTFSIQIDESWMTPFQRRVVHACRAIPRSETLTYGQLARIAGSEGASRAVGSVMAKNRFPLIVPCHRVVSAAGLGGFSAPSGLRLKRRLLELEGALEPLLATC